MAKGSEQFAWKHYPGVPHVCATCQRELLVKDVGEVEHRDGVTRFFCVEHSYGRAA